MLTILANLLLLILGIVICYLIYKFIRQAFNASHIIALIITIIIALIYLGCYIYILVLLSSTGVFNHII